MIIQPKAFQTILASELVPLGLPQDPEQQSLAFFITKFAAETIRAEDIVGGYMDPLSSMLEQSSLRSPLYSAATTTSMGAIAWTPGNADFRPQSLSRYVTSLKRINDALIDPEQSKSDNVLMAVLLLGFYEVCQSLMTSLAIAIVGNCD